MCAPEINLGTLGKSAGELRYASIRRDTLIMDCFLCVIHLLLDEAIIRRILMKIDHIGIAVRSIEAAVEIWQEAFGYEPNDRRSWKTQEKG